MMQFKKKLLSSSVALAIAGNYAAAVHAEEATGAGGESGNEMEEVVVTGIRASLKRSMDIKRDEMGVVDAISAEDMGKFPDANLAESLQRITGVSISRQRGEGSQVTVRGFGPEYNLVTLNGRQMPTHNGVSRSFDFGDLASEGIAGVQVYKTGRADVPSGGIGSTINISTPEPLKATPTASLAVKAVYDTSTREGDDYTPEFSGIYITKFADDRLGLSISGTRQIRNNGVNNASVGGWFTRPGDDRVPPEYKEERLLADNDQQINRPRTAEASYSIPQSMAYNIEEFESERTNGQLVLQWAATDSVTASIDYHYSEYTLERSYSDLSAWFSNIAAVSQSSSWSGGPIATPLYYNEVVNFADFAMGTGEDGRDNINESVGFNLDWDATDSLVLELDHHDSSAETGANSPNGTSSLITMASFNKVGQSIITGYDMPVMSLDLNSGGEAARPLYKNDMRITGSVFSNEHALMEIEQTRLSGTWEFGEASSIDFGVQVSEVGNRSVSSVVQLNTWGGITEPGDLADVIVRATIEDQFDELSGHDHPDLQQEFFVADLADLQSIGERVYAETGRDYEKVGDCGTGYCASTEWPNDIRTTEESEAAWLRYNWSGAFGSMPVDFHLGVRYEETLVTSAALSTLYDGSRWSEAGNELYVTEVEDADGEFVSGFEDIEGEYDVLLPNVDFDIELREGMILRASWSKTITRPSYEDIKGGLTASSTQYYPTANPQASSGNPGLDPIESTNLDVSFEWYYDENSYFSIGYFEKDVKDFIGTGLEEDTLFNIPNIIGGSLWDRAISESGLNPSNHEDVGRYIIDNFQSDPAVDGETIRGVAGDPLIVWTLSRPINQRKTKVDGVELNLQHTFGDTGFGMVVNATLADAGVGYDLSNPWEGQFVLNGLSDSANVIGFYDKHGWRVRLAYNWRDDFLSGAGQGQGTLTNPTHVEAYGQLDVGVTYEFNENITVYFSGHNVTGETIHIYGLTKDQVLQAVQGGPRYDLGFRYSL